MAGKYFEVVFVGRMIDKARAASAVSGSRRAAYIVRSHGEQISAPLSPLGFIRMYLHACKGMRFPRYVVAPRVF